MRCRLIATPTARCLRRPGSVAACLLMVTVRGGAVTNPAWQGGRDKQEQYREHVTASLDGNPWARVIKVSEITDNAVGLFHPTRPTLPRRAGKYLPLLPVLRELVLRADTPLQDDVKRMIAAKIDKDE